MEVNEKMKKFFAVAVATVMTLAMSVSAFAAADVDCSGWWVAHSEAVEVTAEGVEITFKNTTEEGASQNWNGPIWVLYSADEAFAGGAGISNTPGYTEYWVMRGDNYGWGNAVYYGVTGDLNTNTADNLTAAGITWTPDADAVWDNFLTDLKAGADCKATAKLVDGKAVVTFSVAGVDTKIELPVDTAKKTYISLGGELTDLTNIEVKAMAKDTPATGDFTAVLPVALVAVAAMAVVVVMKKRTVTE